MVIETPPLPPSTPIPNSNEGQNQSVDVAGFPELLANAGLTEEEAALAAQEATDKLEGKTEIPTIVASTILPIETVALLNTFPHYPDRKSDLDYAILPNGVIQMLKCSDYKNPEKKTYPDAVPLLWEHWLYGPAPGVATLQLGEAIVIAACGLKGSGKSASLAWLSAKALASGIKVWSNMNVKFYLVRANGTLELCESMPLDWGAVLMLSEELNGGALVVDELSYFASSRQSMSVRNKIMNAAVNQVRKRALDFYTSVKWLRQIDMNIREELDAQISCEDYARTAHGQYLGLDKGCIVKQLYRDISGWSGHATSANTQRESYQGGENRGRDELGEPVYADDGDVREFHARFTWPIYNSYDVVAMADAFRKVQMDLTPEIITDKPRLEDIQKKILAVRDMFVTRGETEVGTVQFREALSLVKVNLDPKPLGKLLKDMGIKWLHSGGETFYQLEEPVE
jgi:hypothetical protein